MSHAKILSFQENEQILKAIIPLGHSIWLDNITREMLDSGQLKALIRKGLMEIGRAHV